MGNGALARRDPFVGILIYLVVAEDAKLVADELGSGPTFNSEGLLQGSIEKGLELGHGNHVHVGVVQDVWNMFLARLPTQLIQAGAKTKGRFDIPSHVVD